ncbi:MAG: hypothetical protein FWD05_04435 [Oscillospiraceae bacterium]|nr:hypothetical protein [Oscillospiraceae bacterium]
MKVAIIILAIIVIVGSGILGYILLRGRAVEDLPYEDSSAEYLPYEDSMTEDLFYEDDSSWHDIDLLFSESNFQRLGELFEETEYYLDRFIEYLWVNDLLPIEQNLRINFTDGEFTASGSSQEIVLRSIDCHEFKEVLQGISDDGIILRIQVSDRTFSDSDVEINFTINREYTEFLRGNYGNQGANFYYIKSWSNNEEFLQFDFRNIKQSWYMRIMPPPG